jgi:CHRD domain
MRDFVQTRRYVMKRFVTLTVLVSLSVVTDCVFAEDFHLSGTLLGRQEVPPASTLAKGTFTAMIDKTLTELTYDLEYSRLGANVTQAHIHFGQQGVNGGIMAFLCSNLPNSPAGTQPCPDSGHISGTIRASDITTGAASQEIGPGNLFAFQRAIRQGVAYVNVHSATFPGGEIRGQIQVGRRLDERLAQEGLTHSTDRRPTRVSFRGPSSSRRQAA